MGMLAAFVTGGAQEADEAAARAEVQKLKVALDNIVAAKAAAEARLEAQVSLLVEVSLSMGALWKMRPS
jgi:hypothetical protein